MGALGVDRSYANSIYNRTYQQSGMSKRMTKKAGDMLRAYFQPNTADPRAQYGRASEGGAYHMDKSRYGMWKEAYDNAFNDLYKGTQTYRDDIARMFSENDDLFLTHDIMDQWSRFQDRWNAYYGDAKPAAYDILSEGLGEGNSIFDDTRDYGLDAYAGFDKDFINRDIYNQWLDISAGGAGSVEDFWDQSEYNKYLTDLGLQNFNRQANLGNYTYNPYDVQEMVKNTNASEMWNAQKALETAAMLQPALSWQETQGRTGLLTSLAGQQAQMQQNYYSQMAELEKWYADAVASGDQYATAQITELMNQQKQQMYQHWTTAKLADAQLKYQLNASMPAQRTMDSAQQMLASSDMWNAARLAQMGADQGWNWYMEASLPNAMDSYNYQADMAEKNSIAGMISGGLGAIGALVSDRRVKDNIAKVGELDDGTPVYRFTYKFDPTQTYHIGVMADEVTPDAVTNIGGIDVVNYKTVTEGALNG